MENYTIIDYLKYGSILGENDLDLLDMVKYNSKIKVYFSFDWSTYKSQIIIEGLDNGSKKALNMPQVPLVGGCFSDYVYAKLVTGQMFISNVLEMVRFNVDFFANECFREKIERNIEVIKIDRCFYAPFLKTRDKNGDREYSPFFISNYPEALEVVKNLSREENYWEKYHDNH